MMGGRVMQFGKIRLGQSDVGGDWVRLSDADGEKSTSKTSTTENPMRLNKEQLKAINSVSKDIVVLACAGSGKTEVLTQRIIRLLKEGISPKEICAVTFTRKAAGELRKRIDAKVGSYQTHGLRIGTFHSICLEMIESFPVLSGYGYGSKLVVYDEEDKASIIKEIKGKLGSNPPENLIRMEYLNTLQRHSAIDYDTMVEAALRILVSAFAHYHHKYRFMFIDEFQDTDINQLLWIHRIKPEFLFVVGDDDQNIYGWRGTDVKAFREFQRAPEREKIILPRNYRSTERIIEVANAVISKEPDRIEKTMIPDRITKRLGDVAFFELGNPMAEGIKIGNLISILNKLRHVPYGEIAILGRTNRQLDELCEYLKTLGLPVERIGRKNDLWKKGGWRLGANILRLLYSPWDAHVYKSILRELGIQGVGDLEILKNTIKGIELWECEDSLKAKFNQTIGYCTLKRPSDFRPDCLPVEDILDASAYYALDFFISGQDIREVYKSRELMNRYEQLHKLLKWLLKKDWSIKQFVHWFNFREVQDELEDSDIKNKVKLMTVHIAKGLEFEAVIIPFCNSDTWPNRRSDPDEERRLFYVAITRAKSYLYFTRAQEDIRGAPTTRSSFMEGIL